MLLRMVVKGLGEIVVCCFLSAEVFVLLVVVVLTSEEGNLFLVVVVGISFKSLSLFRPMDSVDEKTPVETFRASSSEDSLSESSSSLELFVLPKSRAGGVLSIPETVSSSLIMDSAETEWLTIPRTSS